ncbi:MAG: NACHT domain-containing protein, partial [Anaerolineae bacterium]|nr:NACHT domain-containing protein [Anaerolineae bacterium]
MLDPNTLTPIGTATAAWLWDKYGSELVKKSGDVFTQWVGRKAKDRQQASAMNAAAQAYRQKLGEWHVYTRLLGKPDPVPLHGIFSDVYILDQLSHLRRYQLDQLRVDGDEWLERNKKRTNGLELVQADGKQRLFVLGKPGAGKTTFLKYLVTEAVAGKLKRVPIFVSLKDWSDQNIRLLDYIAQQFAICDFPDAATFIEALLKSGDALVLLDGLDEVNAEGGKRADITRQVRDFVRQYDQAQYVVTCRIAAAPEFAFGADDPFRYVELADFTPEQVKTFIGKWFSHDAPKLAKFEAAFYKPENERLQKLATTPLLLTLLCLNFEGTLDFPTRRHEIYSEALEVLLKRWDATRSIKRDKVYEDLSLERKRELLAYLAHDSFARGELLMPQAVLAERTVAFFKRLGNPTLPDGIEIIKAIEAQHGLLTERAHGIYSFSHLTLHEYFAALYLKNAPTRPNLSQVLTLSHITDPRWREVMLMTASMLSDADEWATLFLDGIEAEVRKDAALMNFLRWAQDKGTGGGG